MAGNLINFGRNLIRFPVNDSLTANFEPLTAMSQILPRVIAHWGLSILTQF